MAENFDKDQLNLYGIYDLRRILRSLGGTPGTKSKGVIIDEIKNILETGDTPVRSTRGRKAVKSTLDRSEEPAAEKTPENTTEETASAENGYLPDGSSTEDDGFAETNSSFGFGAGFGETPTYTDEQDKGFTASGAIYNSGSATSSDDETFYSGATKKPDGKTDYHEQCDGQNRNGEQYFGRQNDYARQQKPATYIGNSAQYNRDGNQRNNGGYNNNGVYNNNGRYQNSGINRQDGYNRNGRIYDKREYQNAANRNASETKFTEGERKKPDTVCGVLEMHMDGYGFLRANNYESSPVGDTFIARQQVKYFGLRRGDFVVGRAERTRETGSSSLTEVISVNGLPPRTPRRNFDDLTPYYPQERITLERKDDENCFTLRMMDLLCPLGKGQRGLVVAPPKTGKTTLLKNVAQAIETNHPDIHLIVLLIDERPEEVTDLKSSIKGEVVYSTFDEPPEHHIRAAELVMWRAKRLVELKKDVVVLLDSITRLTRAYNQVVPSSGKILSGGIDPAALQLPKKFFGAARNTKEGGSLTILATALIDTGSKMDDVIYEEFKGTGNMEIHLTRELAEKRIFPAFDLYRSGTRKEELLLTKKELDCSFLIRRFITKEEGVGSLIGMIGRTENNEEFVSKFPAWVKLMEK